jgi:hypothetical protein
LIDAAEEATGVPKRNQKLILNGRTLTTLDHSRTLAECKLTNGCKVMVLGKRHDPLSDDAVRKVIELERDHDACEARLKAVQTELTDVANGFVVNEDHHRGALQGLHKRCLRGHEDMMRRLLALDAMPIEEVHVEARTKKKACVDRINRNLDKYDELKEKIETLLQDQKRK